MKKNEKQFAFTDMLKEMERSGCPPIDGTLPEWPTARDARGKWIGLDKNNFVYSHHSSHASHLEEAREGVIFDEVARERKDRSRQTRRHRLDNLRHHVFRLPEGEFIEAVRSGAATQDGGKCLVETGRLDGDHESLTEALFCSPADQSERLRSIILRSKGGSVLVTGYRGTGKSSLVNEAISRLVLDEDRESGVAFLRKVLRLLLLYFVPPALLFGGKVCGGFESLFWTTTYLLLLTFIYVGLSPSAPLVSIRKWPLWPDVLDQNRFIKRAFGALERTGRRFGRGLRWLTLFGGSPGCRRERSFDKTLRAGVKWVVATLQLPWLLRYLPLGLMVVGVFCLPDVGSQLYHQLRLDHEGAWWLDIGFMLRTLTGSAMLLVPFAMLIQIFLAPKRAEIFGRSQYLPIRVNLSTSRTPDALAEIMIRELYQQSRSHNLPGVNQRVVARIYRRSRGFSQHIDGSLQAIGLPLSGTGNDGGWLRHSRHREIRYQEGPYTLHDAQQDIHRILSMARRVGYKVIFVFDELDKLLPRVGGDYATAARDKRVEVQKMVSDLKFLLTETSAFHIFIAGKDVDDSWKEDQNKGEGLFESIFIQNVYLPSTLSAKLNAAPGAHNWLLGEWGRWLERTTSLESAAIASGDFALRKTVEDFRRLFSPKNDSDLLNYVQRHEQLFLDGIYHIILRELDVKPIQWTYNTGLLILPHLSEQELRMVIRRAARHQTMQDAHEGVHGRDYPRGHCSPEEYVVPYLRYVDRCARWPEWEAGGSFVPSHLSDWLHVYQYTHNVSEATERRCRRLRYMLQYLTFKGRGIPRKILREFYALVSSREALGRSDEYWRVRGEPHYVLLIPEPLRQKIKFFATIVSRLESHLDMLRTLDDKGCVALFHIVDYILKFYQTGFTWSDIENANFMTDREELFPSRELVVVILRLLEDVLIERVERRERVYMLLPRIKHDLKGLYLAFGPEQIELRFTRQEFAGEMAELRRAIDDVKGTTPEQRLQTFKTQTRLGQIWELLGDIPEALLAYSQAVRWIRMDIERLSGESKRPRDQILQETSVINHLTDCIDVLHRLGYLHEFQREFGKALHYYQSAARFYEYVYWTSERGASPVLEARPKFLCESNTVESPSKDPPARSRSESELATSLEPHGHSLTLNLMALVFEKNWQRKASEKFLQHALDYFRTGGDSYSVVDQRLLIGEIRMRRRDVRGATEAYVCAAREAARFQRHGADGTAELPQLQTSSLARLYEHLGDAFHASKGLSFVARAALQEAADVDAIPRLVHEAVQNVVGFSDAFDAIEDRDDEVFYTRAAHYYGMNGQYLRESDVYEKKLQVRQERLLAMTGSAVGLQEGAEAQQVARLSGDAVRTWCSFWHGAERVLNSLVDIRRFVRRRFAQASVIDRRRFGRIFTRIGGMMVLAANRDVGEFYRLEEEEKLPAKWLAWSQGDRNAYVDMLVKTNSRLNDVKDTNDRAFLEQRFRSICREFTDLEKAQRRIDRIYGLLIDNEAYERRLPICDADSIGGGSLLWRLASRKWQEINADRPNSFLVGELWYFVDALIKGSGRGRCNRAEELESLRRRVRLLYRAEVAYLGAHVSLSINMRDLDTAACCRAIGLMYLRAIKWLFDTRHLCSADDGLSREEEDRCLAIYGMLHLAAKRYLVSAIDAYRHENDHHRCTRFIQGLTQRALAELMVVRSEVLHWGLGRPEADEVTLGGVEVPFNRLRDLLEAQRGSIEDLEVADCRSQAGEAYRCAIQHMLAETEEYVKRYRFPNDAYLLHHNIMDSRMHFDIAQSVRARLWETSRGSPEGKRAAQYLLETQRRMSVYQFNAHSRVKDRAEWLEDVAREADVVALMSPRPPGLHFSAGLSAPCWGEGDWRLGRLGDVSKEVARRFFRIYDDGLASLCVPCDGDAAEGGLQR